MAKREKVISSIEEFDRIYFPKMFERVQLEEEQKPENVGAAWAKDSFRTLREKLAKQPSCSSLR